MLFWIAAFVIFCALVFYFLFLAIRPLVYFKGLAISRLLEKCELPTASFFPNPLLAFYRTGFVQTVAAAAMHASAPRTDREVLTVASGSMALDWVLPSYPDLTARAVLVILDHGLLSRACVNAIHDLASRARAAAFLVVLVHPPGVAGTEGLSGVGLRLSAELNSASEKITERVGAHLPKVLVAFSVAAIPALSFLPLSGFAAAAFICAPLDDLSSMFSRSNCATDFMLESGKSFLKNNGDFATRKWLDLITPAVQASTVASFFTEFVDKAVGKYEGAPINEVDGLSMPTLFIYSLDDPCIDFQSIDLLRLIRNDNVAVVVTEQGGHCGFLSGLQSKRWMNEMVLEFLQGATLPVI